MAKIVPIPCGGGLNLDRSPFELAPGEWSDGYNYVFRNDTAEPWPGLDQTLEINRALIWGAPYLTASTHLTIATTGTKVYRYTTLAAETEITRKTDGIVVTNMTASGTTVTVTTASAHGLTAGASVVSIYGAIPTTYNVESATVGTTPTATTFTVTVASAPAVSPATTFGAYHGSATSDFSSITAPAKITGGMFNGIFYFNHPTDGLFYYDSTAGFLRRVPRFANSSTWHKCRAVRFFKDYIFALHTTEGGTTYRQRLRWSTATEFDALPTAFTGSSTNDAGADLLTETPGYLVDGRPLGDAFIAYMQDARYVFRYVGGAAVFQIDRLPGKEGLLGVHCIADYPGGHVFLTPTFDVMVHSGGVAESIAAERVRDWLQDNIAAGGSERCFLCTDSDQELVIVAFPLALTTSVACDLAFAWSWKSNKWGRLRFSTTANGIYYGDEAPWPSLVGSAYRYDSLAFFAYTNGSSVNNGVYGNSETTSGQLFNASLTYTLGRTGMRITEGARNFAIHRSRWDFDGAGAITVQHGMSRFADTAPTTASSGTYTIGTTQWVSGRTVQGAYASITLTGKAKLRTGYLDIALGGTRL